MARKSSDVLFVCGTNAFSPACRNYTIKGASSSSSWYEPLGLEGPGEGLCPYGPKYNLVTTFAGMFFSLTHVYLFYSLFSPHLFAQVTFLRSLTNKQTFLSAFSLSLSLAVPLCVHRLTRRADRYCLSLLFSLPLPPHTALCLPLDRHPVFFYFLSFHSHSTSSVPCEYISCTFTFVLSLFFCSFYHFHITTWRSHCFALFFLFFSLSSPRDLFIPVTLAIVYSLPLCLLFFSLLLFSFVPSASFTFPLYFLRSYFHSIPSCLCLLHSCTRRLLHILHELHTHTHTLSFFLPFFTPCDRL